MIQCVETARNRTKIPMRIGSSLKIQKKLDTSNNNNNKSIIHLDKCGNENLL